MTASPATSPRSRSWLRFALPGYAVAALSVGIVVVLKETAASQRVLEATPLLLAAVALTTWFGGVGPGLLAMSLAMAVVDYYFIPPLDAFGLSTKDLPSIVMFGASALFFVWVSARLRGSQRALRSARDEMEARVRERTAELAQTNEHLKAEIGERQRADEELRERANLLDLTHDSVFVRDRNDVITYWNRGAEALYGWKREDTVGKITSHELLRTIFPRPVDEIAATLLRTGRWEGELVHTKRDGTSVTVASHWSAKRDAQGQMVATMETNNDITDRKRSEQALRRQANLLEQTYDAIFVWEFPRTITYWNRGAERMYGFSREEAIGQSAHSLLRTEHPWPIADFEATVEREGQWAGELIQTTRDGRKIVVESRQVLIHEADGRRLVLETNRDISERKQAEQALDDLAGRLINAQEQERSRIGRELHDHVSQRLGLLAIKIDQLRLNPTATNASALDDLRQETSEITDDIHGLSHRLHSSMLDHLGVVPALQRLVNECSQRYAIPIAFTHASLPAPLSSELALCLFRVVEESLTNMAKHSRAASARVDLGADDTGIRLTVADDGIGFDPSSVKGRVGLGFVSMRERLRLVHGTIDIHSAPAQGTTINVRVPSQSPVI